MVVFSSGIGRVDIISNKYRAFHNLDRYQLKVEYLMLNLTNQEQGNTFIFVFMLIDILIVMNRLITAECDKTIKIYKEDPEATPESHPINDILIAFDN